MTPTIRKRTGWAGSKTVWFGLLVVLLGAIQINLPFIQDMMDPTTYGILTAVIGVIVIVLRYFTNSPVNEN